MEAISRAASRRCLTTAFRDIRRHATQKKGPGIHGLPALCASENGLEVTDSDNALRYLYPRLKFYRYRQSPRRYNQSHWDRQNSIEPYHRR